MSLQQELARQLDEKQVVIKSVQEEAERLIKNHPARPTIEVRDFVLRPDAAAPTLRSANRLSLPQAYRAAMQTQWSWILQLCSCVEQHLEENTLYFEVCPPAPPATFFVWFRVQSYLFAAVFQRRQRIRGLP